MRIQRFFNTNPHGRLREELTDALAVDDTANTLFSPEERAMLKNILHLREIRIEDIMIQRADIISVEQTVTLDQLIILFEESGHSRMPVYQENLDDPKGMVHIRDLLAYLAKNALKNKKMQKQQATQARANKNREKSETQNPAFDLSSTDLSTSIIDAGIIRDVLFVPPSTQAMDLLTRMQAMRTQMALVIDEYGGTDGLVSLEDIVETIVGDIEDEHDDDEDVLITQINDGIYIADAKAALEDIADMVGDDFDSSAHDDDIDTIGGLLFSLLGRVPVRGEVVLGITGFEIQVLDADPRRIKKVRITKKRLLERKRRLEKPKK